MAAAICVPALLVLYLLKLRRRPVRVSSTMFWMARTQDLQVNVPLRWLKPSWLLFLQLLILALFLLALARPALDMEGEPPSRIVVLIDRSASMSARDGAGGESRLDAAKAEAIRLIDDLVGGGAQACVVAFAHEARAATAFLRDRAALRAAVNAVPPTDQPGDLAGALRLAGALLASAPADGGGGGPEGGVVSRGLVALFSDGGFADASGGAGLSLSGAELRFFRAGPTRTGSDNLGIVAVAARRDHDDPGTVRMFARVQNAGTTAVSAPVALLLDGEVIERRALTVPGAAAGEAAGNVGVTLEARTTGGGVLAIRLEREDALASDNAAAVVLGPAARPRVLLVIPDPPAGAAPGAEGPEWLLSDPLRELRARSFRIVPESLYRQLAASDSGVGADLVVFDRVRPARVPPVPSLSFGAGLPIPGVELGASNLGGTYALAWERAHPVLRSVSMDAVYVARPLRVVEVGPDTPPAGARADVEITELARGRDGPLLLLVEDGATRRLVAAFEAAQSNWPVDPGFAVFLAEAADFLTLRGEDQIGSGAGATFTTTMPAEITVEGTPERIVLRGPIEVAVRVPEGEGTGGRRRVSVGVIERAGVYEGESAASPIAVNLIDETESAIRTREVLTVSGEESRGAEGGRGPREIWAWFVLAALALLGVEWFLHAWLMRA